MYIGMDIPINYIAVLIAAIAGMLIGALWYSPLLFGKVWMRLMGMQMGMTPEGKSRAKMGYAFGFIAALVSAYVLAHFVYLVATVSLSEGLILGFWLWLGFIAPVMLGMVLWEGRPWGVYFINVFYQLVSILAMSVILTLWV